MLIKTSSLNNKYYNVINNKKQEWAKAGKGEIRKKEGKPANKKTVRMRRKKAIWKKGKR